MKAIRNAWYIAAWERDLGKGLLPVKLLDEQIVLYRKADGTPVALEDACPHRKLPLSLGRIRGDHVECGYHGLTFDDRGHCVKAPGADRIPRGAQVRSYPIVARYGLLWVWTGAPELARPESIFKVEHWGEPGWGNNHGDTMSVDCHYLYVTDNLLDPSHVAWVHQASLADKASAEIPVTVEASEVGMVVSRWTRGVEVPPFYQQFVRFQGLCDRLQSYEVRYPCHALIKAIFVPAGAAGPDAESHPVAFVMDSYNFMTPVDDDHTRYFWFQMRNFAPDDEAVAKAMTDGIRAVFAEDQAVLKAVHAGMTHRRTPNIDIAVDAGPLRFRRRIGRLVEAENAATVEKPQDAPTG